MLSFCLSAQQTVTSSPQAQTFLQNSLSTLAGGTARRIADSNNESGTSVFKATPPAGQAQSQAVWPQRDPRTIAILNDAVTAAGGAQAIHAARDFLATGKIIYYWNNQEILGSVEIRGRGLDQVRMDSHMDDGLHYLVLNHGIGKLTTPDSTSNISGMNGFHMGLLILPLPDLVAALDDSLASFSFEGTEQLGSSSAYKIRVTRGISAKLASSSTANNLRSSEVFVDTTTSAVIAIRTSYYPRVTFAHPAVREVVFSDFRQVKGLIVPFSITEKVGGQPIHTIALDKIDFNVGITDEVFHQ